MATKLTGLKIFQTRGLVLRLSLVFLIAFSFFPGKLPAAFAEAGGTPMLCEEDASLVGCWPMDEGTGTVLQDGGALPLNDGSINGSAAWVAGKVGSGALAFDGITSFVTIADEDSLDLTSSITLAAWVNTSVTEFTAQSVISKFDALAGTSGYELGLASDGKIFARFASPDGTVHQVVSNSDYLLTGAWMHVAAAYDGATLKLYFNGLEESSVDEVFVIGANDLPLGIGSESDGESKFQGALDEARLYNRALTVGEVATLAGTAPAASEPTPAPEVVNVAPVITGQQVLTTPQNTPWTITLADLVVYDPDNIYPDEFTLTVMEGDNYTFEGNVITPTSAYIGALNIAVKVNDGTADSNTFELLANVIPPDVQISIATPGQILYVNNTIPCNNKGPATIANPLCTIGKGASLATAGTTVYVLAGTYAETVAPTNSGTDGSPITFHAEPGVTVTGGGGESFDYAFSLSLSDYPGPILSFIVIDGFNITHTLTQGIYVNNANHITLTNNHVSYAGTDSISYPYQQGIYLKNTHYSTISGNTTDHNTCIGIRLNLSDNNLISNNLSFANAGPPNAEVSDAAGIEMYGSSHNTVINNITYGNEDSGINNYTTGSVASSYNLIIGNLTYGNGDHGIDNNGSPNNTVVGNTVHGNGTVGINFEGTGAGSSNAYVANNIMSENGLTPPFGSHGGNLRVDTASISGSVIDYNLFDKHPTATYEIIWDGGYYPTLTAFRAAVANQETHGTEGDPLFVNPVAPVLRDNNKPYTIPVNVGDYHLTAWSPAIDSANASAPSQPSFDIEGHARVDDPIVANTGSGSPNYGDRGVYEYQPILLPWTISGNAGVAGATLSYTDGNAKTATADGSGIYSFAVSHGWSGTVTPSKTGYTFSPVNKSYTNVTSNQTWDYSATAITYTISGSVGANGAGATLSYTDGISKTATAEGSGAYEFSVSYNWSGTVTPSKTDYTFTPVSRTYTNVLEDKTSQDYAAVHTPYTISGSVKLAGVGLAGVTLAYTGGSTTTDSSGNYSFTVPHLWTDTVTPSKAGYTFEPSSINYSPVMANQTLQDYSATAIIYTISGSVGVEGAGATLGYTDGTPKTATADVVTGTYSFKVSYNWSGTVTPTKTGFTFSPASRPYTNVLEDKINQDYAPTAIRPIISGSVGSAGAGATINFTGGYTTALGNGDYSFTVSYGWGGTVTPTKTDYTFTPASRPYSNVTSNLSGENYTAVHIPYTISGSVKLAGVGLAGVTMTYTGGSTTTDSSGNYSITVPYLWSGTVTPSRAGYTFLPINAPYTNVTANQAQDYTANAITYTISGSVGAAGAGASMSFTGGTPVGTDGSGNYTIIVPYGWSGTVTPSKGGYTFSPTSRTYTNLLANQAAQNYTPTAITYTISGNAGTGGATLNYAGALASGTVTANSRGRYTITVPWHWSGTVTPSKTGYTFINPSSRTYTNLELNPINQNFTAQPLPTFTISGTTGVGSVTLTVRNLNNTIYKTVKSGKSFPYNYSFTVPTGWSGSVTPTRTGYGFSPDHRDYTDVTSNQTAQIYTQVAKFGKR